jgi:hypothetical protein
MKLKTRYGTLVEIVRLLGNNHVSVQVVGRHSLAHVDASDLVLPDNCEIPNELSELKFFDKTLKKE